MSEWRVRVCGVECSDTAKENDHSRPKPSHLSLSKVRVFFTARAWVGVGVHFRCGRRRVEAASGWAEKWRQRRERREEGGWGGLTLRVGRRHTAYELVGWR